MKRSIRFLQTFLRASLPLLLALGVNACLPVDTSVDFSDALSELHAAIEYKAKECGNRPATLLLPPRDVEQHALRLCSLSIVRLKCPFNEYPLFCTEMFFHIPGAPQ